MAGIFVKQAGGLVPGATIPGKGLVPGGAVGQVMTKLSATDYDTGWTTPSSAAVASVAGKTGAVSLVKADVGLGSVDNTTDLLKPVSTATTTAITANSKVDAPAGSVTMFAGSSIPSGWLLCNGAAISRTTYAALFTALGTTWGTGDGSTTFNLPDMRGMVAVGLDTSQAEFSALAGRGGAKTHLLSIAEMPSHTHIQNAHSHTTAINRNLLNARTDGGASYNADSSGSDATSGVVATNQNTGGGTAHNNLQPYTIMNYIIRSS